MSEQQDKLDQDNLRCEICNTKQTYYRSKLRERVCKICGHKKREVSK